MKKSKYIKQTVIKKERKVDRIMYITILALLIGLPLMQLIRMEIAGSGNMGLYYVFHCGYLIWLCIPVLLVCYLITIFKYKQKIDIIDYLCYALLLIGIISTFTAQDVSLAFTGTTDRYEGFFSNMGYILIFLSMYKMEDKKKSLVLINFFICSGIFQSLYAFGQVFFRQPPFLSFVFPYMANALCGNPNFLGSFLLATSLIGLYFGIFSNKHQKFYITSAMICAVGLVLAQSTIPYLSYLIGLFSIVIYTLVKKKNLIKRCIWITVSALGISLVTVYVSVPLVEDIHNDYIFQNYIIKNDLKQIFQLFFGDGEVEMDSNSKVVDNRTGEVREPSAFYAGRIFIWKNTLKISKNYLLLGVGYDNMGELFFNETGIYIDKAHNHYLNVLVSNGIIYLFIYLALFIIVIIRGLRSKQLISVLLTLVIIPFMIHLFFSVSVIEVMPYFMMVVGATIGINKNEDNEDVIYIKE